MSMHYHDCGCPIEVWEHGGRHGEPAMFDGRTSWNDDTLSVCPQCGQPLQAAALHERPPVPTGILAGYLLSWPFIRRRLEWCLAERHQHDPHFDVTQAEQDIAALERALNRVSALVARLDDRALEHVDETTIQHQRVA